MSPTIENRRDTPIPSLLAPTSAPFDRSPRRPALTGSHDRGGTGSPSVRGVCSRRPARCRDNNDGAEHDGFIPLDGLPAGTGGNCAYFAKVDFSSSTEFSREVATVAEIGTLPVTARSVSCARGGMIGTIAYATRARAMWPKDERNASSPAVQ